MIDSVQVSISATFYKQLFCTKVFCAAFLYLQFGFVIFWQKNISEKAARKTLVKLTTEERLWPLHVSNQYRTHDESGERNQRK